MKVLIDRFQNVLGHSTLDPRISSLHWNSQEQQKMSKKTIVFDFPRFSNSNHVQFFQSLSSIRSTIDFFLGPEEKSLNTSGFDLSIGIFLG